MPHPPGYSPNPKTPTPNRARSFCLHAASCKYICFSCFTSLTHTSTASIFAFVSAEQHKEIIMHIIPIAGSKGGVGKSTTAAELAYYAAATQGHRVLLIDADEQGNSSTRLGITADTEVNGTTADVLKGASAVECATPSPTVEGVDCLVGAHDLVGCANDPTHITSLRKLRRAKQWQTIVIDCPPNLGIVTLAALAASTRIVGVSQCAGESVDQLLRLASVIDRQIAESDLNATAKIDVILPTMYTRRVIVEQGGLDAMQAQWPTQCATPIRRATAVKESFLAGSTVQQYDPSSPVADDYKSACDKILTANIPTPA